MLNIKRITASFMALLLTFLAASCKNPNNIDPDAEKQETVETGNIIKPEDTEAQDCNRTEPDVNLPYNAAIYHALVKPYRVNDDLSNIENLAQFSSFNEEQKLMLSQNAFFVYPSDDRQLFDIYIKNSDQNIPNFITCDTVLWLYRLFYNYSLRRTEDDRLIIMLEDLTQSMLNKSIHLYYLIKNQQVKNCMLKNISYFAVAQMALGRSLPSNIPSDARLAAQNEYALIQDGQGTGKSELFQYKIDYSIFAQDSRYKRGSDYSRYSAAMTWYSHTPFTLYAYSDSTIRHVEQTIQALLITYCLSMDGNDADTGKWEALYGTSSLYNGKCPVFSPYEFRDLLYKVYDDNPDIESINDSTRLNSFYMEAGNYQESLGITSPIDIEFRFMAQQYTPESNIMKQLVHPTVRPVPSSIDIMGVLGSDRAYEIAMSGNTWRDYPKLFDALKLSFLKIPDSTWRSDLRHGWLWCLKSLNIQYDNGYPAFMTSPAWQDKSLNTALAGWCEMLHETVPIEQISGTDDENTAPSGISGYVEPSIEVYSRLLWLIRYMVQSLDKMEALTQEVDDAAEDFENLLDFLINCSVKEMRNEELSDDEYGRISNFGRIMEEMADALTSDITKSSRWPQYNTIQGMAFISSIYTGSAPGSYLEAGIGPAHHIYVVVPIGEKLHIARGGVFSFYEFANTSGSRLTGEEWQYMIDESLQPEQPLWTESFIPDTEAFSR